MPDLKTILAGGRHYQFTQDDCIALCDVDITEVVSGCAPGADTNGEAWATVNRIPIARFPADWRLPDGRVNRGAGPLRNSQMAQYADACVLFPGGTGTADMYRKARAAGLIVYDWRDSIAALGR